MVNRTSETANIFQERYAILTGCCCRVAACRILGTAAAVRGTILGDSSCAGRSSQAPVRAP